VDGLIGDALHLGLQVGTHLEAALGALVALLPAAAAAVAAEARIPGVAVLVGGAEGGGAVAAGGNCYQLIGAGNGLIRWQWHQLCEFAFR